MQVKHHLILILFIPNTNTSHNKFGLPAILISDNRKQFNSHNFNIILHKFRNKATIYISRTPPKAMDKPN